MAVNKQAIDRTVKLGLLAAISILLVYLIHFPIFPAASYLEYDMADVPILIGTFLFGPLWGLLLTAVVSVLQWVLVSPASGWVGALMHFCATGGFGRGSSWENTGGCRWQRCWREHCTTGTIR